MADHEPTLTREADWGHPRIRCSCGWHTAPTTSKGAPMTQDLAWMAWELHHRSPLDLSGDRGRIRARVV